MKVKYLVYLLLAGCASSPEPIPIPRKAEPDFVRHLSQKDNLLYTYKLQTSRGTGYSLVEVDAERLCQSKWQLHAYPDTEPNCGSYNGMLPGCAIKFVCR
jgi:hypothetical protein